MKGTKEIENERESKRRDRREKSSFFDLTGMVDLDQFIYDNNKLGFLSSSTARVGRIYRKTQMIS